MAKTLKLKESKYQLAVFCVTCVVTYECCHIDPCQSGYFDNTQFDVRRAGMWPSLRSTEKSVNTPVMLLAANLLADSTAWSREATLNTIPANDVTKYTSRTNR